MLREEGTLSKSQVPTAEVMKGAKGFAPALDTPEDTVCEGGLRAVDSSEGSLVEGWGGAV